MLLVLVIAGGIGLAYWGHKVRAQGIALTPNLLSGRALPDRLEGLDKDDAAVMVQVKVTDAATGEPLPGFEYRLEPTSRKGWVTNTDPGGVIGLSPTFDSTRSLRVRSTGYREQAIEITRDDSGTPAEKSVMTIALKPGYVFKGMVVDDRTGAAVPGVRVHSLPSLDLLWQWGDSPVSSTGGEGHFLVPDTAADDTIYLAFEHDYYQPLLVSEPGRVEDGMKLRMVPGGLVSCQVLHAGARVLPARMMVVHSGKAESVSCFNRWRMQTQDTSIRFPGLTPGHYVVQIEAGTPLAPWGLSVVEVAKDQHKEYTFSMEKFGGIFGALKGFGDTAGMTVEVRMAALPELRLAEPVVNDQGEFELGFIPLGDYLLRVFPAGGGVPLVDKRVTLREQVWLDLSIENPAQDKV